MELVVNPAMINSTFNGNKFKDKKGLHHFKDINNRANEIEISNS
jgi:hypothetical protein